MRIEAKMAPPSPTERQAILTDIGRRLDHLPIGPMHLKVVVAIGLGLFFEVYEIFLSSTIATALKTQYGLGGRALELLLASSFLGMFIGAAVFGRLADRIGRRRAFLLNLVVFGVERDRRFRAESVVSGGRAFHGRGRGGRGIPGRRLVFVRRPSGVAPWADGCLGLHLFLRRGSRARIPVPGPHGAQPVRCRGLADPVADRRAWRGVGGFPSAWSARGSALGCRW